jgi:hypothetical protein
MKTSTAVLEALAQEVHESTGGLLPVDGFELAHLCGCELVPWRKAQGLRVGDTIRFPMKARPTRQHGVVSHELGHWLLEDAGLDPADEDAARYLAGALLLPYRPFRRDLMACNWDLFAIMERHPNASAEMIVCRMTQVGPAAASIWDAGKLARRYGEAPDPAQEAALVDRVLTLERPARDGELHAWPIFDGPWRRVLIVQRAA